jgi:hypothetical protein
MNANLPILSNFRVDNIIPPQVTTSPVRPFLYNTFAIILVLIIAGIIYYYQTRIHNAISNMLNKLLLRMHINSTGQFVTSYVPM